MKIETGTYLMSNGSKARIDSVKPNGQAIGSYLRVRGNSLRWLYWVWESNGKAKFVEPSGLDLVKKLL